MYKKAIKQRILDPKDYLYLQEVSALSPRLLDPSDPDLDLIQGPLLEDILDLFKCPICLEIFDNPARVRDCGHSFC